MKLKDFIDVKSASPFPFDIPNQPTSRREKRNVIKEIERNFERLKKIEIGFCVALFAGDYSAYNEIYAIYLEKWNKEIALMLATRRFKYTLPQMDYFIDSYKPRETDK